MTQTKRNTLFLATLFLVLIGTIIAIFFARGYRLDLSSKRLQGTGLLVATSLPDGAQVWIDGDLKSATNTTLTLNPGKYVIELKKDGFFPWQKTISLKQEEVVKTEATLFPTAPSFRPTTFDGALNPLLSSSSDRLAYVIPLKQSATSSASILGTPSGTLPTKSGIWILDLGELPLGFSRDPKQITRSTTGLDWSKATLDWSPDGRQILAVFSPKIAYLLDSTRLNQGPDLIDISKDLPQIQKSWDQERKLRLNSQIAKIPQVAQSTILGASTNLQFSPDETKFFYQATASATLPNNIISPLPGSNSRPEQRLLHPGGVYVYDLKEDKNFWIYDQIAESPSQTTAKSGKLTPSQPTPDRSISLEWFPTSRHLVKVELGKITILEYDSTNQNVIYSGPFFDKAVFSYPGATKLAIITNLGSSDPTPNLYSLILR